MDAQKLKEIIDSHGKWLEGEKGGKRANLRGADLRGANLCEANLRGANLREANLREADLPEQIIQVGPIGSRHDYTIYWAERDIVQCGCWNDYMGGSLEEFKKRIDEVYPDGQYRDEYLVAIAMFEAMKERKSDR